MFTLRKRPEVYRNNNAQNVIFRIMEVLYIKVIYKIEYRVAEIQFLAQMVSFKEPQPPFFFWL